MEPDPSNVTGEVVHRHEYQHVVNWGYVAVAVAVIAVLYVAVAREGTMGDGPETEVSLHE